MAKITLKPLDKQDPIFKKGFLTYSLASSKRNTNSTKASEKNTLSKEITKKIDKLSKELVPHGQLSRSKVIEIIVNEKLSNFIKSKEV